MSIMMTILESEWNLTQAGVASLGSSFLMGVVGGNFICAYITNAIGRKTSFTIFVGFSVLLVILGYVFISEEVVSKVGVGLHLA